MARIGIAVALVLPMLACESAHEGRYTGYVEGEFVRVAAPVAGRLVALHVQRGQEVKSGAPLFALEEEREQAAVREAQAHHAAAHARLQLAESNLRRLQGLRERGLSSAQELDRARTERRAAMQDDAALEAQLAQVAWQSEQRAPVATADALVEDTIYRVGEWVPAGAPVVSLLPPANRLVRFFVPQADVGRLAAGTAVTVRCDGCAAPIAATVSFVASRAEFTPPVIYSRDARQKLVFLVEARAAPAQAAQLHPGQPVDVDLAQP